MGVPTRFLDHAKRAEILADLGLTAQDVSRRIIELYAQLQGDALEATAEGDEASDQPTGRPAER